MKQVLIITTAREFETGRQPVIDLQKFSKDALGLTNLNAEVSIAALDELIHVIDATEHRIYIASTNRDVAEFDFVWLRGRFVPIMNEIAIVAEYLQRKEVKFANESYAHREAFGKCAQMHTLAHLNLPLPKTVYCFGEAAKTAFMKHLPFPMIVKNDHGGHGEKNYLVHSEAELEEILATNQDTKFVAQEFIPNDADFRILIAGQKQMIIRRQGSADSHLNNTSAGASASLVNEDDFDPAIVAEARKFAAALYYDMSGVDVMFHKETGNHYFLEANSQPQIISGAFVDKKQQLLADYLAEKLKN
ncbi:ATP-grasp domain-containing protein [Candidatus Saccharibacteria bacterium]|nr:ATP-grasp domain-containing protein [Candidatus Saccharibacteria bacterium]